MNRLMKWPLLCGFFTVILTQLTLATIPLYQNTSPQSYSTANPPPNIDAFAFDNENTFSIDFSSFTTSTMFYQTLNTVNYTNNSSMAVNTGFYFDTLTTNVIQNQMAGTFYNPGNISCASADIIFEDNLIFFADAGKFIAWATNIINPGSVDVGSGGLLQFTGQNVDLSRSSLTVDGSEFSTSGSLNFSSVGAIGTDTNQEWDPSIYLGTNFAYSSAPVFLDLTNSTPYFNVQSGGPSNMVYRAVFVQNNSPNAPYNVYFDTASLGIGGGSATVEWVGTSIDPATGLSVTNYLYLNDDYALGASTNAALINGQPNNFTLIQSGVPLISTNTATLASAGFQNVFDSGTITNPYSYLSAQLIATTVSTNTLIHTNVSALPGRIQITGSNELNLALADISGANYLSVTSPRQFDGANGAEISAAFADLNIGVTNGFLTVSNLLQSSIPFWNGTIQAWSTRWVVVGANGVTNDFRVELVSSQLSPTTPSQVQNLTLNGTNSVIISDALNVFGALSINAQNLTLTTNGYASGATSLDGELNLANSLIVWNSSVPNVLWLTNNGAIRIPNAATFGGPYPNSYQTFINNGILSDSGAIIYANNFASSGTITNGTGSFSLQSLTASLTNGSVIAGGDVSISANTLIVSKLALQSGRSLKLLVTNLLTDGGVYSANAWSVGGASLVGLNLPVKPILGDLLGTTITNIALTNKNVMSTWPAQDYGISTAGYSNNLAIGRLILDASGASPKNGVFTFNGVGISNAMYVDDLELRDQATNLDSTGDPIALTNSSNMVIYYAQAIINGVSVAEKLNHKNNNHLRWLPSYAGHFSSTNFVVNGVTNTFNIALAQSTDIDSDGDGIVNANDPMPFYTSGQVAFTLTTTNVPPLKARLTWQTIPNATNYILYKTNLLSPTWITLTNFVAPAAPPYAPITNVVFDVVGSTNAQRYYRVQVNPNTLNLYGP